MLIRNNLFDHQDHLDDGSYYAVNIQLKSGQIVYLENLKRGQKDAYLNYAKTGTDIMLLTTEETLWRIGPQDIERIDVKAYREAYAKGFNPLLKFIFARSRIDSNYLLNLVRLFLVVVVVAVFASLAISMKEGDLFAMLFDQELLSTYLVLSMNWIEKGFMLVIAAMLLLNITDFIIKPVETYHVIDNSRRYLSQTKALNAIITISFMVFYIIFKMGAAFIIKAIVG